MLLKKFISAVLSVFYFIFALCSCGISKPQSESSKPTLTMWMNMNDIVKSTTSDFGELPIAKELAAKYLDFGYIKQGHMLYNFGIENESYVMKDGYPEYTDKIFNNPDNYSITQSLGLYTMSCYSGPFVHDKRYIEQYYTRSKEHEAIDLWNQTNAWKRFIPLVVRHNDKAGYASSYIDIINNYSYDMILRFIDGAKPLIEAIEE